MQAPLHTSDFDVRVGYQILTRTQVLQKGGKLEKHSTIGILIEIRYSKGVPSPSPLVPDFFLLSGEVN